MGNQSLTILTKLMFSLFDYYLLLLKCFYYFSFKEDLHAIAPISRDSQPSFSIVSIFFINIYLCCHQIIYYFSLHFTEDYLFISLFCLYFLFNLLISFSFANNEIKKHFVSDYLAGVINYSIQTYLIKW